MPRMLNYRSLKEQYDADPANCCRELGEALEGRQLRTQDFSVRECAEAFLGEDIVRSMEARKSGGMRLLEAAQAVDTSAFSNVTGQIIFSRVREAFDLYGMIAEELATTVPTTFLRGEKIPGIGQVGDTAEIVEEGQPFPEVGLNEEYVETPPLVKRGFILPVTREIITADRTGILLKRAGDGGKWLVLNKEKRVVDVAVGATNNYKRNGTATNTFLTSGAYINDQTSNALADWTNVQKAELLFNAITDPNTGEPILLGGPMTLLAPSALLRTALRIQRATDIRYGDGASATTAAYGPNPLASEGVNGTTPIKVLSSAYVKSRNGGSVTKWYYGQPKEAFSYMQAWAMETSQAPANSEADFTRDIKLRFKVSEMGVAAATEPRYWTRNDQ